MAFNNVMSRTDVQSLIPEEVTREIIQNVPEQSMVMQAARRLPDMSRSQLRMPVLSGLITAGFVNGDTGLKQTSELNWTDKYINAEELAVIVPIPEAVLNDQDYDIWGEVRPRIEEAFGKAFDGAVLYGTNAPSAWPTNLLTAATSASHAVTLGTGADLYEDVMGEGGTIALVEEDGFMVNGHIASLSMRSKLRGLRTADGQPIFQRIMQAQTDYELDGAPVFFPKNGSMLPATGLMFSGDWSQLVYSIRQDITFKILDQAVIQDSAGNIVYNLAQQDMVALRAVLRLGWQVPNPINNVQPTEASRYPFSVLLPA